MKSYEVKYHRKAIKFMKKHKEYGLSFYKAFDQLKEDYPTNINMILGKYKEQRERIYLGLE